MESPGADRPPKIDCFYVYPTVSDQKTPLADQADRPEQRSIALYQAARYSQHCRVYAPMYRQVTLAALLGGGGRPDAARPPTTDVREAWRTYLRKYNKGRGVVLIGHSQGTFVLRQLVARGDRPEAGGAQKLVSAILLGGNVTVKKGRTRAATSSTSGPAARPRRRAAWSPSRRSTHPCPANARLRPHRRPSGLEVLCTNPAALGGGSAPVDPISPSAPFAPGTTIARGHHDPRRDRAPTAPRRGWRSPAPTRPAARRRRRQRAADHARSGARRRSRPSPDATWGLHLVDANIALGNLVDLVRNQASAYISK